MWITAGGNSPSALWAGVVSIVCEPSPGAPILDTSIVQEKGLQGFHSENEGTSHEEDLCRQSVLPKTIHPLSGRTNEMSDIGNRLQHSEEKAKMSISHIHLLIPSSPS